MPNLVHLHLLLNHWPIIGTFIAFGLFLLAVLAKSDHLQEAALALFAFIALVSIPAYMTGNLAQLIIQREAGVAKDLISAHQGAALLAFIGLEVTGAFAWVGVWQMRRSLRVANWTVATVLACAVVTLALITVTGTTGGAIRHPEILAGEDATSAVGALGGRLFDAIQYLATGSSKWVWPVLETLHFIGLALLVGTIGLLSLRMLGFLKQLPLGALHRFIPWAFVGLVINVVTGMLFFFGMPFFYVYNIDFHFKIGALVLAGLTLLVHSTTVTRRWEELAAGQEAPGLAKLFAAASIVLWIAVVVLGRYMPMYEESLAPNL